MEFLVSVKDERLFANKELIEDIVAAVKEIKLIKAGKKEGRPVEDLLDEL